MHGYTHIFQIRLKHIILSSKSKICFVYISQSSLQSGNFTIDGNEVVNNVYLYLSKINVLINKYNNNYQIFLFDAIQNEAEELLDKNITLIKLQKTNSWSQLLNQVNAFKYIFLCNNDF